MSELPDIPTDPESVPFPVGATEAGDLPESGPNSVPTLLHRAGGRVADFFLFFLIPLSLLTWLVGTDVLNDEGDVISRNPPIWALLLVVVAAWLYETMLVSARGQTLGKLFERSWVLDLETGEPPTFASSARRSALPYGVLLLGTLALGSLGPLLMMVVYLSSALDDLKRGWHDKMAGTIVVKKR